jgi:nucleoside-diphosphate-sugar epimerase
MSHHLVVGAGPVGSTTAELLAEHGHQVTVLTRSGTGPTHPAIALERGDVSDDGVLAHVAARLATSGPVDAIYNCVNPPYHRWAKDWPPLHRSFMDAAARSGAVLVMIDNLYAFGPHATMPMREGDPMNATGTKGRMRATMAADLLDGHAAGRFRATLARASDFIGPRVLGSAMGERVVPKVLAGKKVSVLGSLDTPHHFTYMPDVARTLVTIATDERAWGSAWHVPNAPARSQRETVAALAAAAGTDVAISSVPWAAVRALGLVVPMMRELQETRYQFDRPFVVDSTHTERTLGLRATPFTEQVEATIAWFRERRVSEVGASRKA